MALYARRTGGSVAIALAFAVPALSCGNVWDIPEYGPKAVSQVAFCDSTSGADACAIGPSGEPRTCFAAGVLGGQDFCTEACDASEPSSDPMFSCLGSGARLRVCDPIDPRSCPPGLSCFRTDLFPGLNLGQPPGLCISVPVCETDDDCRDQPKRKKCAGQVVREKYPSFAGTLLTDHLQCVQTCEDSPECPSGESCLSGLSDPTLPKICVPNCDLRLAEQGLNSCPPNFYCLREAGQAYPAICAPGMIGFRCAFPEDCILGYCAATGAGFSLCTMPCTVDPVSHGSGCKLLNGFREPFLCLQGNCVSKAPFTGAVCRFGPDCPSGQNCSNEDPYRAEAKSDTNLECHRRCSTDNPCARIGDMPYVCLPNGECYPGDMGLPCSSTEECMGELTCENIQGPATSQESATFKICTKPCESDENCVGYSGDPKVCVAGLCQLLAQ